MDAYLKSLETAKKQYQQYVEIRRPRELVDDDDDKAQETLPLSPEDPSTAKINFAWWIR